MNLSGMREGGNVTCGRKRYLPVMGGEIESVMGRIAAGGCIEGGEGEAIKSFLVILKLGLLFLLLLCRLNSVMIYGEYGKVVMGGEWTMGRWMGLFCVGGWNGRGDGGVVVAVV